jgi:protein-disulfide isomerase
LSISLGPGARARIARFGRSVAIAACLPVLATLAGCGNALNVPSLPSQSGTLANTALANTAKPERFNPFSENDTPVAGQRLIIEHPTMAQVLQTGALPERSLGRSDAPITIIKYASMTCPYCRQFQKDTFPILKKRYIDTGKVRFILREFPIGFQSGAATIALRCVPADNYFAAYDALMKTQPQWVSQKVRREPIWRVVRKLGVKRDAFDACYQDQKLIADLNAVKERGRTLGVIGTPNFFINNKLHKRVLTMTDFDQAVAGQMTASAR